MLRAENPGAGSMRKIAIIVFVAAAFAAFGILTRPQIVASDALGAHMPNAGNGRTMFYAGGCAACHATPGEADRTRLGGGLALPSPFGTFYVPNISPDPKDGIG